MNTLIHPDALGKIVGGHVLEDDPCVRAGDPATVYTDCEPMHLTGSATSETTVCGLALGAPDVISTCRTELARDCIKNKQETIFGTREEPLRFCAACLRRADLAMALPTWWETYAVDRVRRSRGPATVVHVEYRKSDGVPWRVRVALDFAFAGTAQDGSPIRHIETYVRMNRSKELRVVRKRLDKAMAVYTMSLQPGALTKIGGGLPPTKADVARDRDGFRRTAQVLKDDLRRLEHLDGRYCGGPAESLLVGVSEERDPIVTLVLERRMAAARAALGDPTDDDDVAVAAEEAARGAASGHLDGMRFGLLARGFNG